MSYGFRWTERSSPAVAATVITASWTLALAVTAAALELFGVSTWPYRFADLALIAGGVTIACGITALFVSFDLRPHDERIPAPPARVSGTLR